MKLVGNQTDKSMEKAEKAKAAQEEIHWDVVSSSNEMITEKSYHEMSEQSVQEMDHLTRLQNNIQMLGDLQGRLSYLMREVKYLVKA
jgi:hypothetical protein